jgi:SAM-dependent methyltransferase
MPAAIPKLEWTGERFLPWIRNATLAYEHLHRYAFAARFAKGKRVLDLGSGEGYGANILALTASFVMGVDIDGEAIRHASDKYRKDNLRFEVGGFDRVPVIEAGSFDLIVCFEAIEHVPNHDELLIEVKRLLRPNGLFIVSTPNKSVYRNESPEENPYHVSELEPEEFRQLLLRYFRETRLLGQRIQPTSSIWPLESRGSDAIEGWTVERGADEFEFIGNEKRVPLYVVALASDSDAGLLPAGSVLIDSSNELFRENEQMTRELLRSRESIDAIVHLRNQMDWYIRQFEDMRVTVAKLVQDNQQSQIRLNQTAVELELIYNSNSWKLLNRIWQVRDALLPPGSVRRRWMKSLLKIVASDSK